jgi:hypothetical protein
MIGLAGCSGVLPASDDSPGTETSTIGTETTAYSSATETIETATTIQATETTETATTAQNTDQKSIEYPVGWNASGVEEPLKAYDQHYSALFSYDSFTRTENWTFLEPGQTLTLVGRVDQTTKQAHWDQTVTDSGTQILHQELYQKGHKLYTINWSQPPTYNSTNRYSFQTYTEFRVNKRLARSGPVMYALTNVRYSDAERITRNGETLFRYESTTLRENSTIDMVPVSAFESTVNEFSMTTVVDSDGLIRSSTYSITYTTKQGKTYTRTGSIRFDGLNSTTVTEPAWVEEARANT